MNKIKKKILEQFEDVKFLPGKDKLLVGYAEMFGDDCILLYKGINYMPCSSPEETIIKMTYINKTSMFVNSHENSLIGHLKLENGTIIYLHDKHALIEQLKHENMQDMTGIFKDEDDCEEGALEWYSYNTIGTYVDGIPAFAVLYSK